MESEKTLTADSEAPVTDNQIVAFSLRSLTLFLLGFVF
jgi:hypothetical protein